jgi:hypothetical protein
MPLSSFLGHDRAANARGQDKDDNETTMGLARLAEISHFRQYRAPCPPKEPTNI